MPVTLIGQVLITGQCHPLALHYPIGDNSERICMLWQNIPLILIEQAVVVFLSEKVFPEPGINAKFRDMLVADANAFATPGKRAFRKAVFSAQRIAANITEQGYPVFKQYIKVSFQCATFVTDGGKPRLTFRRAGHPDFFNASASPHRTFSAIWLCIP